MTAHLVIISASVFSFTLSYLLIDSFLLYYIDYIRPYKKKNINLVFSPKFYLFITIKILVIISSLIIMIFAILYHKNIIKNKGIVDYSELIMTFNIIHFCLLALIIFNISSKYFLNIKDESWFKLNNDNKEIQYSFILDKYYWLNKNKIYLTYNYKKIVNNSNIQISIYMYITELFLLAFCFITMFLAFIFGLFDITHFWYINKIFEQDNYSQSIIPSIIVFTIILLFLVAIFIFKIYETIKNIKIKRANKYEIFFLFLQQFILLILIIASLFIYWISLTQSFNSNEHLYEVNFNNWLILWLKRDYLYGAGHILLIGNILIIWLFFIKFKSIIKRVIFLMRRKEKDEKKL